MEALRRPGASNGPAIEAERLALSAAQWQVLVGDDDNVWQCWGYRSQTPDGKDFKLDLANVSTFLQRSNVEYDQLLDLLHCRFVNPGSIHIVGADCSTDDMTLRPLSDTTLGRMHRFLRLWRNRGWSMLDLDKALAALTAGPLDPAALHRLANLDWVQAATGAPLLEALSWWATMDTFADRPEKDEPIPSLYDTVYLNRAVDADADDPAYPLALDSTRTRLATPVPWDEVRPKLQAALAIDSDALALLLDDTVAGLPNPSRVVTGTDTSLEGLSALYRYVSLARRLGLTVDDLLGLVRLVGVDPFDRADTDATVSAIDTLADIRASTFSLVELHYLLEHDPRAETSVGVTSEAIGQALVDLRDGLARVTADYASTVDPTGQITQGYLATLLDADGAAAVMTALCTPADTSNQTDLVAAVSTSLSPFCTLDFAALIAQPVEARFSTVVAGLAPYLRETRDNAVIVETVGTFVERDLASTQDLLALRLSMTVDGQQVPALTGLRTSIYTTTTVDELTPSDDPEAFAALTRLYKAALVLNRLGIDVDLQRWLFEVGIHNGLLDPGSLPVTPQSLSRGGWSTWARLVDLAALSVDLPGGEPTLPDLLVLLEAPAERTFFDQLAARTGWQPADVDALVAAFAPTFPADWRDGRILRALVDAFALVGRLGVPAAQATGWAVSGIGPAQADELRLAAKSRHDELQWPAIARALRDPVREQQRAALVAYLVAWDPRYADDQDLFDDLLIDVDMAPCMLTSRIKQAISSVQLFVQRAFLNLEHGIELTRDDREQWAWMKNYRVWEAARQVFLYTENWIAPELRDDKSPLFEELEANLMHGELDDSAAEQAYTTYLEGLLNIARVEVMGIYHQFEQDDDGTVDVLHVVARSRSQPYRYYYRQWIDVHTWTAWESLDADIDSNHVVLAMQDRRLFLFWPSVVQKSVGVPSTTPGVPPTQSDYYEMKLAWIERLAGRWGGRNISDDALVVEDATWDYDEDRTCFRLAAGPDLGVECHYVRDNHDAKLRGTFTLDSGSGELFVDSSSQDGMDLVAPDGTTIRRMRFILHHAIDWRDWHRSPPEFPQIGTPFVVSSADCDDAGQIIGPAEDVQVLGKVAGRAFGSYAYPHQYGEFASQYAVFLDDDNRTYQVMPEPSFDWDRFTETDGISPADVGTRVSAAHVFVPPSGTPAFEPSLPWDRDPTPTANGAVHNGLAVGSALASRLTLSDLQHSQTRLAEVSQMSDALASAAPNTYRFSLFSHSYVRDFIAQLRRGGVDGLLDPDPEGPAAGLVRQAESQDVFAESYQPTASALAPYPVEDIDFELTGAYATYNWELFFHAPMLIANLLSQNQRFDEAQRWFHFVFDPGNIEPDKDPLRFWKIKPFYREPDAPIDDFLALAASEANTPAVKLARQSYDQQVAAWLKDPFNPHAIAQVRTTAYQKALVMRYLDNLIGWGDQLFRQDTIESINEATQLYVLALQLLGDRPDALPPRSVATSATFEQVRASLGATILNNPLVDLENLAFEPMQLDSTVSPIAPVATAWAGLLFPKPPPPVGSDPTNGSGFYFDIPPNETLLAYWNTVGDRLFKIRHCMNIEGVIRELPLFEPPIDPGMLVRARAAGVDLSSALADLSAPLPHYRFGTMLQKSYALTQTVRGLGAALLQALEKQDAEALAVLRAGQEVSVLEAMRDTKQLAIDEASAAEEAASHALEAVQQRQDYYQALITAGLLAEEHQQQANLERARDLQAAASALAVVGAALTPIPAITTGVAGSVSSPVATTKITDGQKLAKAAELLGQSAALTAGYMSESAAMQGLSAGNTRRTQEWQQQLELAKRELNQVQKQLDGATVHVSLAQQDLANHDQNIENARSVRTFMEQKFSNVDLYQWMVGQLSSLYFQSYQLAYDIAKQTERSYRHELAEPDATFIQFGYWDSLKKGLLAGDRLQHDLERMDKAYVERNAREYEITRHVSLALLDPDALLQLQTSGSCQFSVPEALFDLDYPGQYLRRLRSVSVTVPCITGPYTGVPMKLSLISSRTRVDPSPGGDYPMQATSDDPRFEVQTGAVQSIVVSSGQDDSGLFADVRDDRYLPCEGSGAISNWSLALTSAVPTFSWATISDVVLHMRYTARDGGQPLRDAALRSLNAELAKLPPRRAFSARSEFPSEWSAFLRPPEGSSTAVLSVSLGEQLFPYLAQGTGLTITDLEVVALVEDPASWPGAAVTLTGGNTTQMSSMVPSPALYGGQPRCSATYPGGASPGTWDLVFTLDGLGPPSVWANDIVLIATYRADLNL